MSAVDVLELVFSAGSHALGIVLVQQSAGNNALGSRFIYILAFSASIDA